ncbi:MAG: hypothetical protein OXI39_05265 [Gemmatimonadota bacterium]|uniref:hypothetical protein n=1 Tax=Candidatus Palauibacter scopulicola TaxID=3056741 RepID=UPI0023A48E76|nr:hypothetical protein [Candidatus Palauibacter scopulicola]MDE2662397.1 hypothetical protein [Candidatus Palauibacter scopulicola]
MQAKKQQRRTRRGHPGGPEPRVVRIQYRPAPDAEARLRRIAAILLDHATRAASERAEKDHLAVR